MIHELTFKNFLSFRDEVTFSFEAANKQEDDFQTIQMPDGTLLLRFAIIFGANASGKSNLLHAFDFLSYFWFHQTTGMQEDTQVTPFLLDANTPGQPSEFDLSFYVEGVRYRYWLTLTNKYVIEEKLAYYKTVQPTFLFRRNIQNEQSVIKFNETVIKLSNRACEELSLKCLPNMSFFAARNMVNISIPLVDNAIRYLHNNIMPMIEPNTQMLQFASRQIVKNTNLKNNIVDFLNHADFNITNISTEIIKKDIPRHLLDSLLADSSIPDNEKEQLKTEYSFTNINTTFEHTVTNSRGVETYQLPENMQSAGTIRTLGVESAIDIAIRNNSFLPIDEIESSLHPDIVEYIIQKFLMNGGNTQLLVTTHYDPLLSTIDDLIRKDSVWFTEKTTAGVTDLYSLIEFKGLNRISSMQKAYRNGKFGAIPQIKG